jgi:hypothetical protein
LGRIPLLRNRRLAINGVTVACDGKAFDHSTARFGKELRAVRIGTKWDLALHDPLYQRKVVFAEYADHVVIHPS